MNDLLTLYCSISDIHQHLMNIILHLHFGCQEVKEAINAGESIKYSLNRQHFISFKRQGG